LGHSVISLLTAGSLNTTINVEVRLFFNSRACKTARENRMDPEMLTSIELENYRTFKHYRLEGLARVNLLTGMNNCGKTSVLEAVQLLASGGDPAVLAQIALERGESVPIEPDRERFRRGYRPMVSHFFHGHEFGIGSAFTLSTNDGLGSLEFRVVDRSDLKEQPNLFEDEDEEPGETLAIRVTGPTQVGEPRVFPVSDQGLLPLRRRPYGKAVELNTTPPVRYVPSESLTSRSMTKMWNDVSLEGRQAEAIKAMQVLEPQLTNITFLSGDYPFLYGITAGILLTLKGKGRPEPLGSHGDGTRRLLALALSLIGAENRILLVDEIDTGLHYTVISDMWRLVVETARRLNIQVFATTHSLDCVRGLAQFCREYPELGEEVSLQKVELSLEGSVALDAEGIVTAADQGIEVR